MSQIDPARHQHGVAASGWIGAVRRHVRGQRRTARALVVAACASAMILAGAGTQGASAQTVEGTDYQRWVAKDDGTTASGQFFRVWAQTKMNFNQTEPIYHEYPTLKQCRAEMVHYFDDAYINSEGYDGPKVRAAKENSRLFVRGADGYSRWVADNNGSDLRYRDAFSYNTHISKPCPDLTPDDSGELRRLQQSNWEVFTGYAQASVITATAATAIAAVTLHPAGAALMSNPGVAAAWGCVFGTSMDTLIKYFAYGIPATWGSVTGSCFSGALGGLNHKRVAELLLRVLQSTFNIPNQNRYHLLRDAVEGVEMVALHVRDNVGDL